MDPSTGKSACVPVLIVVRCGIASWGKDKRRVVKKPNTHTYITRHIQMVLVHINWVPCSDTSLLSTNDLYKGWRESILSSFNKSALLTFYEA